MEFLPIDWLCSFWFKVYVHFVLSLVIEINAHTYPRYPKFLCVWWLYLLTSKKNNYFQDSFIWFVYSYLSFRLSLLKSGGLLASFYGPLMFDHSRTVPHLSIRSLQCSSMTYFTSSNFWMVFNFNLAFGLLSLSYVALIFGK